MSFCNTYRNHGNDGDQSGTENGAEIGKISAVNPSKPDSDEELKESVEASTVLYSFRLAWKIPLETLLSDQHTPRKVPTVPKPELSGNKSFRARIILPTVVENSNPLVFEDLKIHPFYLELTHKSNNSSYVEYDLNLVSNNKNNGIILNYAFISYEDIDYFFQCNYRYHSTVFRTDTRREPLTRDALRRMSSKLKYVTIMCQVTADVHLTSPERVGSESNTSESGSLVFKCSSPEKENSTNHCLNYPISMATREAVCKYLFYGEIPKLNVGLAKEILKLRIHIDYLKSLSNSFLEENLNPENVVSVLDFAFEHRLEQGVINECIKYMAEHCKVIEKDPKVIDDDEKN